MIRLRELDEPCEDCGALPLEPCQEPQFWIRHLVVLPSDPKPEIRASLRREGLCSG